MTNLARRDGVAKLRQSAGMRIFMIMSNTVGRGTYWRAAYLAQDLARRGHEVTVMATSADARFRFKTRLLFGGTAQLVEAPDLLCGFLRSGWDPWATLQRIRWLRQQEFDLVHAFESRPVVIYPALYLQRRLQIPLVMDWADWFGRGGSVEERPSWLVRTLLRPVESYYEEHFRTRADYTSVITSFLGRKAANLGVAPDTILLIPNASNPKDIRPIPQEEARQKLGLPDDTFLIGYIGAIFQRDAQLMANTFDLLLRSNPQCRLLVIGYCNLPVAELVADPTSVIQTGPISFEKIGLYLSACDILWLPLVKSGANLGRFPGKIYEYMAVGKPVIATDIEDVKALIHEGQFGLVAEDNPEALASQAQLLIDDSAMRRQMGDRARQMAETDYRWEMRGKRIEAFYKHILHSKEHLDA
jgi:glycosyltransferase involved in cell wall biosynthesis